MTQLAPGQNMALPTGEELTVRLAPRTGAADLLCLLLDASEQARGRAGLVHREGPQAAGGAVSLDVPTGAVTVRLSEVPGDVTKLLFAAQASGAPQLGGCTGLEVVVAVDGTAASGTVLEQPPAYPVVRVAEVYRHAGGWKVRGLADGYADGLARLLAEHGVAGGVPVGTAPRPAAPRDVIPSWEALTAYLREDATVIGETPGQIMLRMDLPEGRSQTASVIDQGIVGDLGRWLMISSPVCYLREMTHEGICDRNLHFFMGALVPVEATPEIPDERRQVHLRYSIRFDDLRFDGFAAALKAVVHNADAWEKHTTGGLDRF